MYHYQFEPKPAPRVYFFSNLSKVCFSVLELWLFLLVPLTDFWASRFDEPWWRISSSFALPLECKIVDGDLNNLLTTTLATD
jgi:hypothetical protein